MDQLEASASEAEVHCVAATDWCWHIINVRQANYLVSSYFRHASSFHPLALPILVFK